jgi:hypothetical protein
MIVLFFAILSVYLSFSFYFQFQCAILMGKNSSVHKIFFLENRTMSKRQVGMKKTEREKEKNKASAQGMNGISADNTQINVHYHAKNNTTLQAFLT